MIHVPQEDGHFDKIIRSAASRLKGDAQITKDLIDLSSEVTFPD